MKKSVIFILFLIIILASILRFWQLGNTPVSPDWDEVSLGYNAYSILHTGRDEYGKFLPMVFRSYDDYKPGLYVYLIIPFIKLFGLSVPITRLPSAVLGIVTVLVTFFLVKELTKNEKLGLISSFILSISPWHIQFSRVAFEANTGVAFNVLAALFFLKGLRRPWFLILSVIPIIGSIYVYQSERVFGPMFFLALILIYWRQLFHVSKKYLFAVILIGCILLSPLIFYIATDKQALARVKGVSIFSDTTSTLKTNAERILYDRQHNDTLGLIIDNRRFVFAKEIFGNYISHWDFNWLFITGDISRHHAPGMGLLYLWEFPFLLIGIYIILFGNFDKKTKVFFITWFLLVPIPASITTGVPHAVRTINFLPLIQIFIAVGLLESFNFIKDKIQTKKIRYITYSIFCIFVFFNIVYYLNQYFIQQKYFTAIDWQYGYQEAVPEAQKIIPEYKKIIVSNSPFMDQSYMFFLFYLKYPPSVYQEEAKVASGGFRENHTFGKFEFRPIVWEKEEKNKNILYIGRENDFPLGVNVLRKIYFPNGKIAMLIVKG